jgi:threonine dehydrogenase-like Zn-dependent dehydrogenase
MKAAVYWGEGKPLVVENLPDPHPGPGEVLLKVHRCGICGTDLHMTSGHHFDFPAGTVPGHEYAGEIVEVGKGVSRFSVGDRITALPTTGCGRLECEACRSGNLALCRTSPGVMGGFGEYIRVPEKVAVRLPDTLSLADGALIEPLAVGLYGVRMANIRAGDRVLVLGAGAVALCTIYWARRLGAGRIVAMSRDGRRAEMALQMGASQFIPYGDDEVNEVAGALGGPADIVFECVGAEGLLAKAIEHARTLGQVLSLGFCTSPDTLVPAMAAVKGVTMQFPVGYALRDFEYVAGVMDAGHVDPKVLISSVIPLQELPDRIEALRGPNQDTKVHVTPGS